MKNLIHQRITNKNRICESLFIRKFVVDSLFADNSGQAILLVVLVIGGAMLSATTIAGFLITIQLQQVGDVANSAKAIFAADAGINCALYDFNHPSAPMCFNDIGRIDLINRAHAEFVCYKNDTFTQSVLCNNQSSTVILSKGTSGTTKRAFLYTIIPP